MTTQLDDLILALHREIAELEAAMVSLERLAALREGRTPGDLDKAMGRRSKRGRKFMGPEERKEVSRRMKAYWASRREGKKQ